MFIEKITLIKAISLCRHMHSIIVLLYIPKETIRVLDLISHKANINHDLENGKVIRKKRDSWKGNKD